MAREANTMTAARAIIKSKGKAIGYMKNLRITETISRGSVMGIGRLTEREKPPTSYRGTWSCDFYMIDLEQTGIPGLDDRNTNSQEVYENTLILSETPIDLYVYKEEVDEVTGDLVTKTKEIKFAVVRNIYLNNSSWDVTENQISARQQSGDFTDPIIITT